MSDNFFSTLKCILYGGPLIFVSKYKKSKLYLTKWSIEGNLIIQTTVVGVCSSIFSTKIQYTALIYSHLMHPERLPADQRPNLITGTTVPPINIISQWNNDTPTGPKTLLSSPHFVTRFGKTIDLWHDFSVHYVPRDRSVKRRAWLESCEYATRHQFIFISHIGR